MPDTLEDYATELRTRGYTVIEGVLDSQQIAATSAALEEIFAREAASGLARERGWHNDIYKVAYMLPQKHAIFRSFCQNPRLLPLMKMLLGDNCVVASLNGLTMTPGGETQPLHIDQNETVAGNVLYINALHALDDFTRENGCTRVVPYSQDRKFPKPYTGSRVVDAEMEAVYLEAPAGSLIAYNGGLWHAGSQNKTSKPRRAIHAFFSRSWVRPQWDYPKSLSPDVAASLTEEQRRLFGFSAQAGWYDYKTDKQMRDR